MARRCFWPPDNFLGYSSFLSSKPTFLSNSIASFSASSLGVLSSKIGVIVIFSKTVKCGNTLKCWKIIPIFLRCVSISTFSAAISTPSKIICPLDGFSNKFRQRKKVDFPEPLGPIILTTSP